MSKNFETLQTKWPRGVMAVMAMPRAADDDRHPRQILSELTERVHTFSENYRGRIEAIEGSLDDLNRQVAAGRMGGGAGIGDEVSPQQRKAALKAFASFVTTGNPEAMRAIMPQAAGMSTDDDPRGGYAVPTEIGSEIIARQLDISPMRRLATVRQSRTGTYEQLMNAGGGGSDWVGERQARPETDPTQLRQLTFTAHEIYANPAVTQNLLDDSTFDIAGFVTTSIAEDFDVKEGTSFITGDGVLKPRGFLEYDKVTTADATRPFGKLQYVPSGVAGALSDTNNNGADALTDMVYKLRAGYRRNATWLMNSLTASAVRKLKDGTGRYLWQEPISAGQPPVLLGYPVETDEGMPDIGANEYPVAFGDWKRGYLILDRIGVRVLRDPFTNKPYVHFYTTKRVGGGLLHSDAIKLLKIATT